MAVSYYSIRTYSAIRIGPYLLKNYEFNISVGIYNKSSTIITNSVFWIVKMLTTRSTCTSIILICYSIDISRRQVWITLSTWIFFCLVMQQVWCTLQSGAIELSRWAISFVSIPCSNCRHNWWFLWPGVKLFPCDLTSMIGFNPRLPKHAKRRWLTPLLSFFFSFFGQLKRIILPSNDCS